MSEFGICLHRFADEPSAGPVDRADQTSTPYSPSSEDSVADQKATASFVAC